MLQALPLYPGKWHRRANVTKMGKVCAASAGVRSQNTTNWPSVSLIFPTHTNLSMRHLAEDTPTPPYRCVPLTSMTTVFGFWTYLTGLKTSSCFSCLIVPTILSPAFCSTWYPITTCARARTALQYVRCTHGKCSSVALQSHRPRIHLV